MESTRKQLLPFFFSWDMSHIIKLPFHCSLLTVFIRVCRPQIAEWVISSWLSHTHHLRKYAEDMKTGRWENSYESPVTDSVGATM
jgi:hypothetical protein